jgi:hypothetical protein
MGTWAGHIITGDENSDPPLIITISTNRTVEYFNLGIAPEDFDIIPEDQDLYCVDQTNGLILRVPRTYFANDVGKLLITQEGAFNGTPGLYIVNWNNATSNFEIKVLKWTSQFEHVTFAPITLQRLP